MIRKEYHNLFEDEIIDVLKTIPDSAKIITHKNAYYMKNTCGICEDGIFSIYAKNSDLFRHYIDGKFVGYANLTFLIDLLYHADFTVQEEE